MADRICRRPYQVLVPVADGPCCIYRCDTWITSFAPHYAGAHQKQYAWDGRRLRALEPEDWVQVRPGWGWDVEPCWLWCQLQTGVGAGKLDCQPQTPIRIRPAAADCHWCLCGWLAAEQQSSPSGMPLHDIFAHRASIFQQCLQHISRPLPGRRDGAHAAGAPAARAARPAYSLFPKPGRGVARWALRSVGLWRPGAWRCSRRMPLSTHRCCLHSTATSAPSSLLLHRCPPLTTDYWDYAKYRAWHRLFSSMSTIFATQVGQPH